MTRAEEIGREPAFPVPLKPDEEPKLGFALIGMTMRQWYKGQMASHYPIDVPDTYPDWGHWIGLMADALLAEDAAKEAEHGDK